MFVRKLSVVLLYQREKAAMKILESRMQNHIYLIKLHHVTQGKYYIAVRHDFTLMSRPLWPCYICHIHLLLSLRLKKGKHARMFLRLEVVEMVII